MSFKSIFKKSISLSQAGQANKHSKKASSLAKQAIRCFKQAKSLDGDKKINKMLDGLNYLSNSILEVSDTITPISNMSAANTLLDNNIQKMINQSQTNIINTIKNKKNNI
tara:strand:- start:1631 stop:1960 length:330 start_codon:yes stop_codon:yes gene_type:complete